MTSFFPDLNVWLALSVAGHSHSRAAWSWLGLVPDGSRLIFSRYTQIGLLRLLTNQGVMGEETLNIQEAWNTYDEWLTDPRIEFRPEPRTLDDAFRQATAVFARQSASKLVGDCYLLACAKESNATLATFDAALLRLAHKQHCRAVIPA